MRANDVKPPLKVQFPATLQPDATGADLYGYFHPATHHVLVLPPEAPLEGSINLSRGADAPGLMASHQPTGWIFSATGRTCIAEPYELDLSLFSRHRGLLQASAMRECGVLICGCGSVGSLAALDLARSGVGRFLLVDDDILSIENLCRHQGALPDVGRHKVEVVADRIRQINPYAEVLTKTSALERVDPSVVAEFCSGNTLIVACADSRRADRYAARLAVDLQLPFLSIGLWERAFAGELFTWQPGCALPCYSCAFAGLDAALSARPQAPRRFYSTQSEQEAASFQPGLAIDIAWVTQIGLKLALDLLNSKTEGYVARLLGQLSQYTLVCNSNDPRLGGEAAEIFSHPLQVTTSIQVGGAEAQQRCCCCSS